MTATAGPPWSIDTLANGLRIATTPLAHSQAAALAVYVGVGSRAERRETLGLSHYLEHMLFRGTDSRPSAMEISEVIEGAGGTLNAFTTKELTCFWNRVPYDKLELAMDVLSDSVRHSLLAPSEIDRERTVIQQEIRRAHDEPGPRAARLLSRTAYGDQPIGWDVIGSLESVDAVRREHLDAHIAAWYQPANLVLSVAGRVDREQVLDLAARFWADQPNAATPAVSPAADQMASDRLCIERRDIEQCNLAIGLRTFSREDPDRFTLDLLNEVLGEGFSSRLFQEVRERRGLAYSIGSGTARYADTGHLQVGAGVTREHVVETAEVVLAELQRLTREHVPVDELERAREHAVGSFRLSLETAAAFCHRGGGNLLLEGRIRSVDEVLAEYGAVTPDHILRVARRVIHPGNLAVAVVGPYDDRAPLEALLAA